jgi:hypothetical protein
VLVIGQADLAQSKPLCQEEPYRKQWAEPQALLDLAPYWADNEVHV